MTTRPQPSLARNVPLYYLFNFLRDFQIWIPVWVVFLTLEQGFSLTEVTAADACFLIGIVVLEVPTGAVADRWGRSRSVGLGALLLAVAIGIFALTTSFTILLASFLTWSLAHALMSGADMALLYDSLKGLGREAEYERRAGLGGALAWAGAAMGTLFGGPVAAWLGTEATIWAGVVTTVLAACVAFAMVEPTYDRHEARPGVLENVRIAAKAITGDAGIRWMVLLSAGVMAAMGSAMYLVQPYLLANGVEVGIVFSLLQVPQLLGGMAGSLLAYRAARMLGERRVIVVCGAIGVGAYAGAAAVTTLGGFVFIPIFALFEALTLPVSSGYINRRVESAQRATVLSMHSFAASVMRAPLAVATGMAADAHSPRWAFGMLGVVLLAVVVAGLLAWGHWGRRGSGEPALTVADAAG